MCVIALSYRHFIPNFRCNRQVGQGAVASGISNILLVGSGWEWLAGDSDSDSDSEQGMG
jgi:hypothetical protein